jgi:hypothetical protein
MRVPHTSETGGGSWPTPTTEDAGRNGSAEDWRKYEEEGQTSGARLRNAAKMWPTPRAIYGEHPGMRDLSHFTGMALRWPTLTSTERSDTKMFLTPRAGKTTDEDEESWLARHAEGKVATPPLALAARMIPTPTSRDHKDGDAHSCQNVPVNGLLGREVHLLPTPNASDAYNANMKDNHDVDRSYLRGVVHKLPTPSSGGESGGPHGIRGGSWPTPRTSEIAAKHTMQQIRNRINQSGYHSNLEELVALETPAQGSLSPDWVSWLMGLPIGWTSLEPLPREEYLDWFQAQQDGTWWLEERGLPRVATGIKDRVNRLKCLGNGIVPASLALFLTGENDLYDHKR